VKDTLRRVERDAHRISRYIASFGVVAMLIVSCVIVFDVLSRWFVGPAVSGLNEIVQLIFAVAIAACLPAGLASGVNLSVDICRRQFGTRLARRFEALGEVTLLVFYALLAWRVWIYAEAHQGTVTTVRHWPQSPFLYGVAVLFVLAAIMEAIVTTRVLLARETEEGRPTPTKGGVVSAAIVLASFGFCLFCLLYGFVDFAGLSRWTIAHPTTATTIASVVMWGVLMGLIPIASTMALIGLGGTMLIAGIQPGLDAFSSEAAGFLTRADVIVLPLFLLMGNFAATAGMSEDIYRLANALFRGFRGGLALATIGGCAGFGAVTGSSVATAATFGKIAMPEMRSRGYSPELSTGAVCAGGTLGALVPPSGALVVYALLTETSIGQLFIAAIVPAALAVAFYLITILLYVKVRPRAAPAAESASRSELFAALRQASSVLFLFALVIGGLYVGVFTGSESAAVGAVVAFGYALARGKLKGPAFWEVMADTVKTTAMIYSLIIGALTFSFAVGLSNMPFEFVEWIRSLDAAPIVIIIVIVLIFTALGTFMDTFAIMFITLPVVVPLLLEYNFDLIWWGIVMLIIVETGQISPPFGLNLFVIRSVAPNVSLGTVFLGVAPFCVADVIKLALVIAFPALALWLPATAK
jgi:tripartite ATP-independent transporter DctM subunit